MSAPATIPARDLPLLLAAAKLRRWTGGATCRLCSLSAPPLVEVDCNTSEWLRPRLVAESRRYGRLSSRVQPMDRGGIARLFDRVAREHGRAEVLRTWGAGIRSLRAEPRFTLTDQAQQKELTCPSRPAPVAGAAAASSTSGVAQ